jgi:para-nitrobenzyl esterase
MVWIHGGSFVGGSGSGGLYRGGHLARDGDVVVVTLNYRLGMLGFLAHPALATEDASWADGEEWTGFGNWGLADQVAALRWVRDHIAEFGGDPGNVTLFGESAGGMSVSALLAAPVARGLFHRAVVESGGPYAYTPDQAASVAEQLAGHLGVPLTRAALEQVPAAALVEAVVEFDRRGGRRDTSGLVMMPVVDGGLLPTDPGTAVANGSAADIPLLIGTNRDEMSFFTFGNSGLNALDLDGLRHWLRRLSSDDGAITAVIATVTDARASRGEPVTPRDLWVAIASEFVFRVPSVRLADAHQAAAATGVGTYMYLFTWASPLLDGYLGSCHAHEIPFVFGTVRNPAIQGFSGGGADALDLSSAMGQAWTTFARTGLPGTFSSWSPELRPTAVLGPWPGRQGYQHRVDRPRAEEFEAVASVMEPPFVR